jgi:hypothetical protein
MQTLCGLGFAGPKNHTFLDERGFVANGPLIRRRTQEQFDGERGVEFLLESGSPGSSPSDRLDYLPMMLVRSH